MRTRPNVAHHRKVKRTLKRARGYYGARSKLLRPARDTVLRAGAFATRDRRARKGDFRSLWITRITAAARARGISYSRFMAGLRNANIGLNRKMLSEIAIHDAAAFDKIVEVAKQAVARSAA